MLVLSREWTDQPPPGTKIKWESPLLKDVEYVLLGSDVYANPTWQNITYASNLTNDASPVGVGPIVSRTAYFSYLLQEANGGTTGWTIAGIFIPRTLPSTWGSSNMANVAGCCESPGSSTQDRALGIKQTGGVWAGYLYDQTGGTTRFVNSTAVATVDRADSIVVSTDGATFVCAVNGYADASMSVQCPGAVVYTSAEFCVGRSNDATLGNVLTPLLVRTRRYWPDSLRASFFANPWQIFE